MKKYLSLLLVALLLFAFLVSCSALQKENGINPPQSSITQNSSNQSTDSLPSSESENGEDSSNGDVSDKNPDNGDVSGEEKDGYVTVKAWSEEINPTYYKTINIKANGYKGNDFPSKKGDYYKLFTDYHQLRSLYDTVENIEPVLFKDYDLLMLYRYYGSRGGDDIGFSDFVINDDYSAQIKLCETGSYIVGELVYKSTVFILVPKQGIATEQFHEINVIKDTVYPYEVTYYEEIGIELNGEALFFNDAKSYNKFAEEHGLKRAYQYGERAVLIIKNPHSKSWLYGPLSLNGNELTLNVIKTLDQIGFEQTGYAVIEIERNIAPGASYESPYPAFEHTVTTEMSLKINLCEYQRSEPVFYNESDFGKALYDESDSFTSYQTIYMYFTDRTVIGTRTEYDDGDKSHVIETFITNRNGEITAWSNERYYDYENICYYEIEDGVWKKKDGILLAESLFTSIATGNVAQNYGDLSYDIDTGAYYTPELKIYDTFYNLEIKFFDTFVMSVSYEQYGRYSDEAVYEYNKTVYFNRNNTTVDLPKDGELFVSEDKIPLLDEETASIIAYFHARQSYGVLERRLEKTLNYSSSYISEDDKEKFWFISFYSGLTEYIYKISKEDGKIINVMVSEPE